MPKLREGEVSRNPGVQVPRSPGTARRLRLGAGRPECESSLFLREDWVSRPIGLQTATTVFPTYPATRHDEARPSCSPGRASGGQGRGVSRAT